MFCFCGRSRRGLERRKAMERMWEGKGMRRWIRLWNFGIGYKLGRGGLKEDEEFEKNKE